MSRSSQDTEEPEEAPAQQGAALRKGELYPDRLGDLIAERDEEADLFDLIRENMLVGYGYNTARAYWGDLEHWRDWCLEQEPVIEPLRTTAADIQRYLDEMHEAGYSPNTRARRLTTLRAFYGQADMDLSSDTDPTVMVAPVRRRH